jgi:hypothetical protein
MGAGKFPSISAGIEELLEAISNPPEADLRWLLIII